jgi:hypothetical protein
MCMKIKIRNKRIHNPWYNGKKWDKKWWKIFLNDFYTNLKICLYINIYATK